MAIGKGSGQADDLISTPQSDGPKSTPNIIFILADDLGYGDVRYNGGAALTPNLDAMASGEHSIRFDRFYSSAPVCSPTRGSVLTGRNHNRFCIWSANTAGRNCSVPSDFQCPAKRALPASEETVAEILQQRGYRTAVYGKWHLGDLKPHPGNSQPASNPTQNGFEEWKVTERAVPTSTPNCGCFDTCRCNKGHWKRKSFPCTNYHGPGASSEEGFPFNLQAHPELIEKDDSDFILDEFSKFLAKSLQANAPFFAYLPFHSVHKKFIATPPYDKMYDSNSLTQEQVDYYASISALDAAVGKIRALLEIHNISKNTILWFTSDNGPSQNCPGSTGGLRGRKGSLYEGGIRVPGIIEWPATIHKNRLSNYPASTTDFVPTVQDILGLERSSKELDGISILPVLKSTEDEERNVTMKWAFNVAPDFKGGFDAVIMNNQYKLIARYRREKIKSQQLFDLKNDPSESNDISEQNAPLVEQELVPALEEWVASIRNSAENEVGCLK